MRSIYKNELWYFKALTPFFIIYFLHFELISLTLCYDIDSILLVKTFNEVHDFLTFCLRNMNNRVANVVTVHDDLLTQ